MDTVQERIQESKDMNESTRQFTLWNICDFANSKIMDKLDIGSLEAFIEMQTMIAIMIMEMSAKITRREIEKEAREIAKEMTHANLKERAEAKIAQNKAKLNNS